MRMLQAVGSSSAIAVGAGTIGGLISQTLGWRWIFWVLSVMSIVLWAALTLFLPETLRSLVGNGSGYANPTPWQLWKRRLGKKDLNEDFQIQHRVPPLTYTHGGLPVAADLILEKDMVKSELTVTEENTKAKKKCQLNVFRSLSYLKEKDIAVLLLYNSLQYGAIYSMLSSLTKLFTEKYNLSALQIGLCYLASGFGSSIGSFSSGRLLNWQFNRYSKHFFSEHGMTGAKFDRKSIDPNFPIEAARLNLTWIWGIAFSIFITTYGWCVQMHVHLAVPLTMAFFMTYTSSSTFCAINTLLLDLFPKNSAAIIASNNLTRYLKNFIYISCQILKKKVNALSPLPGFI
ncbi:major facilitator superfamily domain-containing protein [Sporodiniella umbellata]|nr:major facilitator superfamily domain-containing protein [Sporodiniella umbellata]